MCRGVSEETKRSVGNDFGQQMETKAREWKRNKFPGNHTETRETDMETNYVSLMRISFPMHTSELPPRS